MHPRGWYILKVSWDGFPAFSILCPEDSSAVLASGGPIGASRFFPSVGIGKVRLGPARGVVAFLSVTVSSIPFCAVAHVRAFFLPRMGAAVSFFLSPNHWDFKPREVKREEIPWMLRRQVWTGVLGSLFAIYMGSGIYFTMFCREMGMEPYQFGILSALVALMAPLMLFSASIEEWFGARKYPWFVLATASRACFAPFLLGAFLKLNPWMIIALCVLATAFSYLAAPIWLSWTWDYIPSDIFGRFWARRHFWAKLVGSAFGLFFGVMVAMAEPGRKIHIIIAVFALLFALGLTDLIFHRKIPETPRRAKKGSAYAKALATLKNRPFRRWMVALAIWSLATAVSGPFCIPYMMYDLGFHEKFLTATILTIVIPSAGTLLTLKFWGRIADKWNPRNILVICYACWACIPLFYYLSTPDNAVLTLGIAWAAAGIFPAGVLVASSLVSSRMAGEDKTMPVAMLTVCVSLARAAGSGIGTLLVTTVGVHYTFAVSLGARYTAVAAILVLLLYVPMMESGRRPVPVRVGSRDHARRR